MKKFITLTLAFALSTSFAIDEKDANLLESLKNNNPFGKSSGKTTASGIGTPQMLSLRSITKVGDEWYFSIFDASINASFWIRLKDNENENALIKANLFDDENNEIEISTASYTHILSLKERDPLTGAAPNLPGTVKSYKKQPGVYMQKMLSHMNSEQKASMAFHLAASMLHKAPQQNNQQNNQKWQNNNKQNNNQRGNSNSAKRR